MSNVYIFGAGPTGLTLAWIYANRGKKVIVYDKYETVGGSWATKWNDDGLFTQHSPQILSTAYVNTFDLFNEMKIDRNRFLKPYNSSWRDMDLEIGDLFVLSMAYINYMFRNLEQITVEEYFGDSLSERGKASISSLCYLLDGVPPSKMTMAEMFGSFDQAALYSTLEMSKSCDDKIDGMGTLWMRALENVGVEFKFNTELINIEYNGFTFKANIRNDCGTDSVWISRPNELIMAIDPGGLVRVLDRSPEVRWSWGNWFRTRNHLTKGIYHSLSIQFHFDEDDIYVTKGTEKGTTTEFGIICVKVPSTVTRLSGGTLSSTILNIDHVTNLGPSEVINESWRQIKRANPHLPTPRYATIGEGTEYINGKWKFDLSAAVRTTLGSFSPRGSIPCLSIVGPINDRRFKATTMESAVEAAKLFTNEPIRYSMTISNFVFFIMMIIIVLTLYNVMKNSNVSK
jgi:hypothetical protein